jgi:hypothetical protein
VTGELIPCAGYEVFNVPLQKDEEILTLGVQAPNAGERWDSERFAAEALVMIDRLKPQGWKPIWDDRMNFRKLRLHTDAELDSLKSKQGNRKPPTDDLSKYSEIDWKRTTQILTIIAQKMGVEA